MEDLARIKTARGETFDASISNVNVQSAFLKTAHKLAFRDQIVIEVFGLELPAEVVYVSQGQPPGVGILFLGSEDVRSRVADLAKNAETERAKAAEEEAERAKREAAKAAKAVEEVERALARAEQAGAPARGSVVPIDDLSLGDEGPPVPKGLLDPSRSITPPPPEPDDPSTASIPDPRAALVPDPPDAALIPDPPSAHHAPPADAEPPIKRDTEVPSPPKPKRPSKPPSPPPKLPISRPFDSAQLSRLLELPDSGKLSIGPSLEALAHVLTMLSGRPLVVRCAVPPPSASFEHGAIKLALEVTKLGVGLCLVTARDRAELERIAAEMHGKPAQAAQPAAAPAAATQGPGAAGPGAPPDATRPAPREPSHEAEPPLPDPKDVPSLEDDVVRFQSHAHYLVQHKTTIGAGAIIVKAPPAPPGTKRTLTVQIPGIDESVSFTAMVAFQGEGGTVGFMIEDFGKHKAALLDLTTKVPKKVEAARPSHAPSAAPVITFKGKLKVGQGVKEVFEFSSSTPKTIEDCHGSLIHILQFLYSKKVNAVCVFASDKQRLITWVHDGQVVHTRREPPLEDDMIARRLVRDKKISPKALEQALNRAKQSKQPIGKTLLMMGEVSQSTLNATIRAQAMDRLLAARGWSGEFAINPWADPKLDAGLVPVSGKSLISTLLTEQLRVMPLEEVEKALAPLMDRTLTVDAGRVDPGYALDKKEVRFFELAAEAPVALRDIPVATAMVPAKAWRLVVLGHGLGIARFGAPPVARTKEEIDEARFKVLKEQLAKMEKGTHFDALGLHWTASESDIKKALLARQAELKDDLKSTRKDINEIAHKLIALAERANVFLGDAARRKDYRHKMAEEPERVQSAEHMLDQVDMMILRGQKKQAEELLRTSKEIALLARAKTLAARLSAGTDAADIE